MKTLPPGQLAEAELLHHRTCAAGNGSHVLPIHRRIHITDDDSLIGVLLDLAVTDLADYIDRGGFGFDSNALKAAFLHLLDAVSRCHARGIYHRDIKPANILRSPAGDLLLADFGMCTPNARSTSDCGTTFYMTPEMLREEEYACAQSDTWALGVTFLNMLSSSCDFPWGIASPEDPEFAQFLATPHEYLARTYPISTALTALLVRVFHPVPAERPSLQQMKQDIEQMETLMFQLPDAASTGSSSIAETPEDQCFDDYPWEAPTSSVLTSNASAGCTCPVEPQADKAKSPVASNAKSSTASAASFCIPAADDPAVLALPLSSQARLARLRARGPPPKQLYSWRRYPPLSELPEPEVELGFLERIWEGIGRALMGEEDWQEELGFGPQRVSGAAVLRRGMGLRVAEECEEPRGDDKSTIAHPASEVITEVVMRVADDRDTKGLDRDLSCLVFVVLSVPLCVECGPALWLARIATSRHRYDGSLSHRQLVDRIGADRNRSWSRVELRKVLKQDLDFKGEFAFGRAFPDAPNPCLTLDDVGLVGLPLSPEGAKAVIGQCVEAPFGKGERTVVDKHVRDTWEMVASKVKFRNPAWNAFVNRLVGEVCTALAVNVAASQPRAELYKLLVYEKGSHFLPHVDTEKANGMFASIIIVLPSEFTGGDVHTSHSGVHSTFNSSKGSLTQTTVLAWYTDVKHEVKPITGGYRFALSYNLMHTTTALRPALSSATGPMQKLRSIFQAWNADESASDRIYYLLDHDYSMANLSASALKGKDAHIIAVLDTLAKEIGFGLGLACMEMTETGSGDGDGGGYSYGRRRKWGYSYEEEDDDEDVDFVEDPERTASIECFVDPDGNPIEDDDLEADDSLHEELKSKGHYNQEYEGYMGNYAGTLERFYRSSILVIWPRWSTIGGGNADRRATGSFERLESCDSDAPTAEERSDFEYLCEVVRFMDDTQDDAIELLFDTAVRWCDAKLWSKAVVAVCGGVRLDAFGLEHLRAGYEAFGFGAIAETL
uniref:Protein kinase domain-containing protein n=1 Tax=Mycena chlorophos TaxID=658473 RepID=A0ABQ0LKE7_MYCCL|nr:predicted protein [Mycena chlorophos]